MSQQMFKVKPVQSYDTPRYFAAPVDDSEVDAPREDEKINPVFLFLSILLVMIVMFGLSGCYMRNHYNPDDDPDDDPDGDPPDPDACDTDEIVCADDWTLEVCVDGAEELLSCDDYCFEEYGYDYYSMGCNEDAADPCSCEFGMLDGIAAECEPGEVRCVDESTIEHCEDWWLETQSCHDWCQEHYGWEFTSYGCNEDAEEVCQCDYDMVDGGISECYPDDVYCVDTDTVEYCDPGSGVYSHGSCDDYCSEIYGEGTESEGCEEGDYGEDVCGCIPGFSGSGGEDS